MSVDPRSLATDGFLTCSSDNCNPCTRASDGFILYGSEVVGGGWFNKEQSFFGYPHELQPETDLVVEGETTTEIVEKDGLEVPVEIKRPDKVIQALPIARQSVSVTQMDSDADIQLARYMRRQAILDHAKKEREEVAKHREFNKQLSVMMILMLDEM